MFQWNKAAEWKRLWRYYQAGIVNTLFGYAAFALLMAAGMGMYAAQATAHVAGMTFNYFVYSRYAFAGHEASIKRFVLSYAVNYVLSVGALAVFSKFIASPYISGILAIIFVSAINYLILGNFVFSRKAS